MRVHTLLLVLSLVLPCAGCGDGGESPLRVDIQIFSFDDALPEGLRIRRLRPDLEPTDEVYDLEPVPGGRRGEYQAAGAPDGSYMLEGPDGWWMLHEGGPPPNITRTLQPPLLAVARGRAIYLVAESPEIRPSSVWGAVRVGADGTQEPVPVTVEADEQGYVVAVRFAPEDWRGTLQVVGRILLDPPPAPTPGPDAQLADPIRFEATTDGDPVVTRVRKSPTDGLEVVLVPASDEVQTDGLRVRASLEGLPIPTAFDAYARNGLAHFLGVPAVDRILTLQVGEAAVVHRVDPMVRRRQASFRLLVTGEEPTERAVVLADPEDGASLDVDLVLVRPAGAVAYGRVPFERVDGGISFPAPRRMVWVLLRSGTRWASGMGDGAGGLRLTVEQGNLQEGVVVGGRVAAAQPGTIVRFFKEVAGHDEAVLGDGFEVRVEPSGTFEAHLPTGRYRVEVATRLGTWSRPAPLVAESPGARLHLPLESP